MSDTATLTYLAENGRACWSESFAGECGGARWLYRSSITHQVRPLCPVHARQWVLEDLAVAVAEARTAAEALAELNVRVDSLLEILKDVPE